MSRDSFWTTGYCFVMYKKAFVHYTRDVFITNVWCTERVCHTSMGITHVSVSHDRVACHREIRHNRQPLKGTPCPDRDCFFIPGRSNDAVDRKNILFTSPCVRPVCERYLFKVKRKGEIFHLHNCFISYLHLYFMEHHIIQYTCSCVFCVSAVQEG